MAEVRKPFPKIMSALFLAGLWVSILSGTSHATVCASGLASVIGTEYVATSCPGEASTYTYKSIDLYCQGGTVIRNPGTSGDYLFGPVSPAQFRSDLIALAKYYGDRLFENSEGTRFLRVGYRFANGGSIDGKSMSAYQVAPNVHTDVFDKIIFVDPQAKPPCCLKIQSFASNKSSFNPSNGESATFNGSIFANYPVTWEMSLSDRLFTGSGTTVSKTWDGKNAAGSVVAPGTYSAGLTANTSEVMCTDMASALVEVAGGCVDQDGDGHFAISPNCPQGDDCNDNNNTIYPGAPELCDGKDNNCNRKVDEACWGNSYLNTCPVTPKKK